MPIKHAVVISTPGIERPLSALFARTLPSCSRPKPVSNGNWAMPAMANGIVDFI
jgi:hypothetical protein